MQNMGTFVCHLSPSIVTYHDINSRERSRVHLAHREESIDTEADIKQSLTYHRCITNRREVKDTKLLEN